MRWMILVLGLAACGGNNDGGSTDLSSFCEECGIDFGGFEGDEDMAGNLPTNCTSYTTMHTVTAKAGSSLPDCSTACANVEPTWGDNACVSDADGTVMRCQYDTTDAGLSATVTCTWTAPGT